MPEVWHDESGCRFYLRLESGEEASLLYRQKGDALDFFQTYVPPHAREKGLAEKIVEAGFRYAKSKNLRVIPSCLYVSKTFLNRRQEFLPLSFLPR